jgi:hypothetical protein
MRAGAAMDYGNYLGVSHVATANAGNGRIVIIKNRVHQRFLDLKVAHHKIQEFLK